MRFAVFTTLPGMARIGLLRFADDTSATKREETIARYAKLGLAVPKDATEQARVLGLTGDSPARAGESKL